MLIAIMLIVLPYLTFVFLAETFNPLAKPDIPSRRSNWRFARKWALAVFCGCCCSIYLFTSTSQNLLIVVFAGMSITLAIGVFLSYQKILNSL